MVDAKPSTTPKSSFMQLSSIVDSVCYDNPSHYKSIVGALQCTTLTRPDIFFSVNEAC